MKRKRKNERASLSAVAARKLSRSNHPRANPVRNGGVILRSGEQVGPRQADISLSVNDESGLSGNGSPGREDDGENLDSTEEASSYNSEDGMIKVSLSEDGEDVIHIEENSSDSESDVSDAKLPPKPAIALSSFVETPDTVRKSSSRKRSTFIFMKPGDYITILGHFDLRLHKGLINLCGATLKPSKVWHRLYSPSTHALCPLRCVSDRTPALSEAEIEIRPFHSGIRAMEELSRTFANIWNPPGIDHDGAQRTTMISSSSYVLLNNRTQSLIKQLLTPLQTPVRWEMMLQEFSDGYVKMNSSTLICGPKGTGKSTFSRLLTNTLLTLPEQRKGNNIPKSCVAFLDLDPGQPDYTPSGHITLSVLHSPTFGPPFTHPGFPINKDAQMRNKIIRSHFVAATTPKHDPGHFDDCVRELMARYSQLCRTYDTCPLVVNCPGWIQGPGFEFMKRTVQLIKPNQVIYMSQEGPQRVVDGIQKAAGKARFHILPSQESNNKTRTSADLRMMQTISYFHLSDHQSVHLLWTAKPVMNHMSWEFKYAGTDRGIFGIMIADENCQSSQLYGLLDGSVVGIVVLDDDSALNPDPDAKYVHLNIEGYMQQDQIQDDSSHNGMNLDQDLEKSLERLFRPTKESFPYIPGPLPSPSKSHCIGLGFVRTIDISAQTMSIATPVSKSHIAHLQDRGIKIVLVLGRLDTPGWAYAEEAIKSHFWWRKRTRNTSDDTTSLTAEETAAEKKRITELLERSPWLKERSKKEKRPGEGPWKVRRNLVMR